MIAFSEFFLSVVPIPVVYVLYFKYLKLGRIRNYYLESMLSGILLASLIILISPYINQYFSSKSKVITGFFHAALIEKGGAFIFLYLIIPRIKAGNRMIESVSFGMFFGLGFSLLENIFYSMQINENAILFVRTFSAVPVHVSTCGFISYFLALSRLSAYRISKVLYFSIAFIAPVLFHGIYDTSLLMGGFFTYIIGPELVLLIVILEYMNAHSLSYPDADELHIKKIGLEDWQAIKNQNQYDRWILRSMGKKNEEYVPFFRFNISPIKLLMVVFFLSFSIMSLFFQKELNQFLKISLKTEEKFTLFILFPLILSFSTIAIGSINSLYFENSIIRIPIISDVEFFNSKGISILQLTCMEISGMNCFLKTFEPIKQQEELEFTFSYANRESPTARGDVIWENHEDLMQPIGTIIRFSQTNRGFRRFLLGYYIFKIWKGIFFYLKLPGFHKVRKFFVKANTVMEDYNNFTEKTVIYEEGQPGDNFYLLRKGKVEEYRYNENGEKLLVNEVLPGEVFGEMAVVTGKIRKTTAICVEDSIIAIANAVNLEALFENNPQISTQLVHTMATRIQAMEEHIYSSYQSENQAETFLQQRWQKANQILDIFINEKSNWILIDQQGEIQDFSSGALKKTGYSRNSLLKKPIELLFGPEFAIYPGEQEVELHKNRKKKTITCRIETVDIATEANYKLLIKFLE